MDNDIVVLVPQKVITLNNLFNWLLLNIGSKNWNIGFCQSSWIIGKNNIKIPAHAIKFKYSEDAVFFKMSCVIDDS
ncbi:MAG: hypothetical protein HC836_46170 [Richelia sp. RM2_1_2]|nr:hypothetical protein [Richelia sp. RM2_1_2]